MGNASSLKGISQDPDFRISPSGPSLQTKRKDAFAEIQKYLTSEGVTFTPHPAQYLIIMPISLEDKQWVMVIMIFEDAIMISSIHPINCPPEFRSQAFGFLNELNNASVLGTWQMDLNDGEFSFRCSSYYKNAFTCSVSFRNLFIRNMSTFSKVFDLIVLFCAQGAKPGREISDAEAFVLQLLQLALEGGREAESQEVNGRLDFAELPPEDSTQYQLKFEDLKKIKKLGSGNFAKVTLCDYRGTRVAVKRLNCKVTSEVEEVFMREVSILKSLAHPNILLFIGYVVDPPCIVTEYCDGGTLEDLIGKKTLDPTKKLSLLTGACQGMVYLHNRNIFHGDIKAANILVDGNRAKIADFGLSVVKNLALSVSGIVVKQTTPANCAPEIFETGRGTFASDVYAFGIVINHVWSEETPYLKRIREEGIHDLGQYVVAGGRPDLAQNMPAKLSELVKSTWKPNPTSRPKFDEILPILNSVDPNSLPSAPEPKTEEKEESRQAQWKKNRAVALSQRHLDREAIPKPSPTPKQPQQLQQPQQQPQQPPQPQQQQQQVPQTPQYSPQQPQQGQQPPKVKAAPQFPANSPAVPAPAMPVLQVGDPVQINADILKKLDQTLPFPPLWTPNKDGYGSRFFLYVPTNFTTYNDPRVYSRSFPRGWEERRDYRGMPYYLDHNKRQSTYTDPRLILPPKWEERRDPRGIPYFVSHDDKFTTYIDPRLVYCNQ